MQAGKLPIEMLSDLLSGIEIHDPRVVLGPAAGEDAALIDFGDRYLVAKSDPITFATDLIGWYLVQVNANDIAVMGATPKWLMATLLLPEGTTEDQARTIFEQLSAACGEIGVDLVGGHTEITLGLSRPLAVGAMLGEVPKERVVTTSGARPGDAIVVTKGIAIEGTAILARECEEDLRQAGVPTDVIRRAQEYLFAPGISVLRDASTACDAVDVHSMHDPTEGGLATALAELALAAGVGIAIDEPSLPITSECLDVCRPLGLDPLGLIASGSLLATVAPSDAPKLIDALAEEGIPAYEIGRVTSSSGELRLATEAGERPLPAFQRDELARYLEG